MSKTKSTEKIELKLFETESLCQSCLHRILGCFIANIFTDGAFKKKAPPPNIVLSIVKHCLHVCERWGIAGARRWMSQCFYAGHLSTGDPATVTEIWFTNKAADPCFVRCWWDNSAYSGPRAPCSRAVDRSLLIEPHSCSHAKYSINKYGYCYAETQNIYT